MKNVIIDERMRQIEKRKLSELGYNIIEIKQSDKLYQEISSHVDIFVCKTERNIIVEPSKFKYIKDKLKNEKSQFSNEDKRILSGNEEINAKYPYDIKYNVCIIGRKALHNFEYTDSKLKTELIKQGYEMIDTTQGYTNCSIAVIDNNSAIVTDKGLYKILQKNNINVLYLDYEPDIKLLKSEGYSNRNGFIGGAVSRLGDKIIVFGDLNEIDINGAMRKFISQRGLDIIDFKGLDVIDYGGIIEIDE